MIFRISNFCIFAIEDRQQEVWPVLMGPRFNGYYYLPLCVKYMYYIHVISLLCGLFIDRKHVKITWTDTIQASSEFENSKFATYFFNKDFSFNTQVKCLNFLADVDESH